MCPACKHTRVTCTHLPHGAHVCARPSLHACMHVQHAPTYPPGRTPVTPMTVPCVAVKTAYMRQRAPHSDCTDSHRQMLTCSDKTLMLEPAARATSSNLSGNSAMMSSVWVPMEPVDPSREKRCSGVQKQGEECSAMSRSSLEHEEHRNSLPRKRVRVRCGCGSRERLRLAMLLGAVGTEHASQSASLCKYLGGVTMLDLRRHHTPGPRRRHHRVVSASPHAQRSTTAATSGCLFGWYAMDA